MAVKDKEAPAKAAAKEKVPTVVITGKPEKEYRSGSARAEYWQRFNTYHEKPLAALEESCQKDPPSKPKKGRLAEKVEPFGGWLSFFKQAGFLKIIEK